MLQEFKKFAMKGNVIDIAVGIIIGGAFSKIVSSFVSDVIMPPIGLLLGGVDFSSFSLVIQKATLESPAIEIKYGLFINTIVDFVIISFALFILIKQMNRFKKVQEEKVPTTPEDILLLREIRDNLKNKSK
ncbi:MAG: large-conductance mechanosensitive channel protein MscL [Candidatus Absconditabacteria bacterium]